MINVDTTGYKEQIKTFLSSAVPNAEIGDDEDIFASGYVNSLFVMQLVLFVEKKFDIALDNDDLDVDNFKTISAIATLVEQKKQGVKASS